ncbi:DUF2790 domain-containing protein [Pseudomonas sp. 21LCFQ02]|uniref:DUF2790 domain-containing protein n=1 Tax=unclassified Pseudomonas TaxID=196821 RepID=UPI0004F7F11C|nr:MULTISPECIES: DUF2790 domain-containing protein [unclassified Pseudomonas]MCO8164892.1 DUF2790 domain-containing protein [Pseudomonas sp. 21LCFQ010]MCO8166783.1 DUF2790 domain-containing protein [Pseudomonas sp. 21LCFQ02]MCQ9426647.1 DUF2790 domain-containing protein [Pseudomonas sp. LJDD11]BAP44867.1 putative uncharacterized protein [Pseudomonas sp. StFLB209]
MKYVLFAALSLASLMASANDQTAAVEQPVVQQYGYGQNLDIKKVVSIEAPESDLCEPVVASMVYMDSQGVEHELHYKRLSETCSSHG